MNHGHAVTETDPGTGRWTVTPTDGGLHVTHDGDPSILAAWLTDTIQVAQSNEGLRRRAERLGVNVVHAGPPPYDIGPTVARLTELRVQANASPTVVSKVLGYGNCRIGEYERGTYRPRIDAVEAWALVLGHELRVVKGGEPR